MTASVSCSPLRREGGFGVSDWVLIAPIVDHENARGCVESLAPELRERVIIIDNCKEPWDYEFAGQVWRFEHNTGVAGAWNMGVAEARRLGCSHAMIVSTSIRFGEEGGRDIDKLVADSGPWGTLPAPTYWHTIFASIHWWDTVGLADENFYPAYWEDSDLQRRSLILNCLLPNEGVIDAIYLRDGMGSDRLRMDFPGMTTINYDILAEYWMRKWGRHHYDAMELDVGYLRPYNDESKPVTWWEPVPSTGALMRRYGLTGR